MPRQNITKHGGTGAALDYVFNLTLPFIPANFLDEMAGMSDASNVSLRDIRRVSMIGELTNMSCSMFGAWGPATAAGSRGLLQVCLKALKTPQEDPDVVENIIKSL